MIKKRLRKAIMINTETSQSCVNYSILRSQLQTLMDQNQYPFHMPGHKRNITPVPDLPVAWDITEIEGSDDLHDAQGILKEAMERTAALCGADRTWYLVGGSTCGNLAAVRAAAPRDSEVIVARNCHKSIYHAIELGNLQVHWIAPPVDESFGVYGSVPPEEIKELLDSYPDTRAVILTSPTYDGVLSDIRKIAAYCHDRPKPAALVVDEAHGAHLGLSFGGDFFGEGAVACGADLVIQSTHKTLPSLTQTALLHVGRGRMDQIVAAAEVERQLDVFETSSPSYPLMASLDGCTGLLQEKGAAFFTAWEERLREFDRCTKDLKKWKILCHGADSVDNHPLFYAYDPGKILFTRRGEWGRAAQIEELLQREFHMELEMRCGENLLAMTSCADSPDALIRLSDALHALETLSFPETSRKDLRENAEERKNSLKENRKESVKESVTESTEKSIPLPPVGKVHCTIAEAVERARTSGCRMPIREVVGAVSGEYLWAYPPGVPIAAPGEEITEQLADYVSACLQAGTALKHSGSHAPEGKEDWILVLK